MTILGNVFVGVMTRGLAIVDDAIVQLGCRQWRSFKPIYHARYQATKVLLSAWITWGS